MMTISGSDTNCNVSITVEVTICKKVTVCNEILCRHRGQGAPGDHWAGRLPGGCTPAGKDGEARVPVKINNQTIEVR